MIFILVGGCQLIAGAAGLIIASLATFILRKEITLFRFKEWKWKHEKKVT